MARSSLQWMGMTLAIAGAGALVACGGGEQVAPTGLPMGQAPAETEASAETSRTSQSNDPPEIDELVLRPDRPRPGERLTAVVEASDVNGDPIKLSYTWTVDGNEVRNRSNEFMLKDVKKGSYVEVSVVARDGKDESDAYEAGVTISNRPPVLRGVVFEPLGEVSVASDVTAAPRAFDPDGDEVEFEYTWYVNDSEASTVATLPAREFRRGDEIVLEVVAYDEDDESEPLVSAPVTVVNAKPKIVSKPSGFGGEDFNYKVEVDDPDGDRNLRFHLVKGPDGMRIDNLAGTLTWSPGSDQVGSHAVEIAVDDQKGGEDVQSFELTLGSDEADEATPASPTP